MPRRLSLSVKRRRTQGDAFAVEVDVPRRGQIDAEGADREDDGRRDRDVVLRQAGDNVERLLLGEPRRLQLERVLPFGVGLDVHRAPVGEADRQGTIGKGRPVLIFGDE